MLNFTSFLNCKKITHHIQIHKHKKHGNTSKKVESHTM